MSTIRIKQICEKTSLSRAMIYRIIAANQDTFPEKIQMGSRIVMYDEAQFDKWYADYLANLKARQPIAEAR